MFSLFLPDSMNRQSKFTRPLLVGFDTKLCVPSSGLTSVSKWSNSLVSDFDFMITALVYLFHRYFFFFFGIHIHEYGSHEFCRELAGSGNIIVSQLYGRRRFLVIYLCALMWLRYKVSFIPLWVRLRYSFFRSNNPLTEVKKKKKKRASRRSDAVKSNLKTACDWIYGCFMWAMRFS